LSETQKYIVLLICMFGLMSKVTLEKIVTCNSS